MSYIMSLDQGTTSSRTMLFDAKGLPVASASKPYEQHFPQPGWVEHDPMEIVSSQRFTMQDVLFKGGIDVKEIEAIGVTDQRETTIVWDRKTGRPLHNAIVWQCRRTAAMCDEIDRNGWTETIRQKTGLVLDPYFSGTKLRWILDHVPGAQKKAESGELCFGNVDSWLIFNMTAGRSHVTDVTNASRTMLFNIHALDWDDDILRMLNIPRAMLPKVMPSSGPLGMLDASWLGREIPILGDAGDQHASLFGHGCFAPGMCKNTYGTGCFLLMNTGTVPVDSPSRLLTTVAWQVDGVTEYALEGGVFMGGASIQWLKEQMGLISKYDECAELAASVPDTAGVYLVPAFAGLGAPHWDAYARGTLVGMTRGTNRAHIVRATLEGIAYQCRDVLDAMARDSGNRPRILKVDGGATANPVLMQFQSDIMPVTIHRPAITESTARGAAFLAGLACGFYKSKAAISDLLADAQTVFTPAMEEARRNELYAGWQRALERSRSWAKE